ncbi:MAG: hypothetical protein ACK2TV_05150, partial [Anaerolineales bacterium]
VTVEQAGAQTDPTNTSPINFIATFNEEIDTSTFTFEDVTLGGTAGADTILISELAPNDGTTFNLAVSGMVGNGTVSAEIPAGVVESLTGKANRASTSTDNEVIYDITSPEVTVEQAVGQTDPTNVSPIYFEITFSESINISSLDLDDVTLTGTSGADIVEISELAPNDGTTFQIAVSGMTQYGTVIASIDVGRVEDLAGNLNSASFSEDNTVLFEIYFSFIPLIIK